MKIQPLKMQSTASRVAVFVGVTIGYIILAQLGLKLATLNHHASPVWPAPKMATRWLNTPRFFRRRIQKVPPARIASRLTPPITRSAVRPIRTRRPTSSMPPSARAADGPNGLAVVRPTPPSREYRRRRAAPREAGPPHRRGPGTA